MSRPVSRSTTAIVLGGLTVAVLLCAAVAVAVIAAGLTP